MHSSLTETVLEEIVGRQCGGSTGTNVYGAMQLLAEMARNGTKGSLVTLICDAGDRYVDTYYLKVARKWR
jgi:cysteine synthase A